jgi:hypothetical protein
MCPGETQPPRLAGEPGPRQHHAQRHQFRVGTYGAIPTPGPPPDTPEFGLQQIEDLHIRSGTHREGHVTVLPPAAARVHQHRVEPDRHYTCKVYVTDPGGNTAHGTGVGVTAAQAGPARAGRPKPGPGWLSATTPVEGAEAATEPQ